MSFTYHVFRRYLAGSTLHAIMSIGQPHNFLFVQVLEDRGVNSTVFILTPLECRSVKNNNIV